MKHYLALILGLCLLVACGGEATSSEGPPPCASVGETWTRPADGMEMVCVPDGEFLRGSTDDDPDAHDDGKPQHTVYLDAFWIDRTEVTNAQYRRCVEAGACRESHYWDDDMYNAPNQPVVGVVWDDAQAYSSWVGGQLPTEAQWEKAARGTAGRIYPWGDEFDCRKGNFDDEQERNDYVVSGGPGCDGYVGTAPVGSFPAGASPYGALDMAGNVYEWGADWYDAGYYARSPSHNPYGPDSGDRRVLRGGAFLSEEGFVRCAFRYRGRPNHWGDDVGFRVVVAPGSSGP